MPQRPAIPSLLVIPDESQSDYAALYAMANSYAQSGLLISAHGKEVADLVFSFPAVVCSSLAIELFLKFFLMLERTETEKPASKQTTVNGIDGLWTKISPARQALIAGMFRNSTELPLLTASERRIDMFSQALNALGDTPSDKWLRANELDEPALMSHAKIDEIVEALSSAATYLMREKSKVSLLDVSTSDDATVGTSLPVQVVDSGLVRIPGSERVLLGRDSVLRKLPVNLEPKQALFLDGIRHAAEILDVTYGRLRKSLTKLALHPPTPDEIPEVFTHVFLDAWGFVDAIDRFRMMYSKMPGLIFGKPKDGIPPLLEVTQEFRNLRNVADHLATRADYVLSRNGSAMGELSWLTGVELQPEVIAWHCTLRPGTLQAAPVQQTGPILSTLDWPTDSIRLSAGEYEGNLSEVRKHIAVRIRHLEAALEKVLQQPDQAKVPIINDAFMRRAVTTPNTGSKAT
jgi:hypothetical protein